MKRDQISPLVHTNGVDSAATAHRFILDSLGMGVRAHTCVCVRAPVCFHTPGQTFRPRDSSLQLQSSGKAVSFIIINTSQGTQDGTFYCSGTFCKDSDGLCLLEKNQDLFFFHFVNCDKMRVT